MEVIELRNRAFRLRVDTKTGWPVQMASLDPSPIDLLNPRMPFVFGVRDAAGKWIDLSRVARAHTTPQRAEFDLAPSVSEWEGALRGRLSYGLDGDSLRCSGRVQVLQDRPGEHEVRFAFGFRPKDWDAQSYPGVPREHVIIPKGAGYIEDYNGVEVGLQTKQGEKNLILGTLPAGDVEKTSDIPWASLTVPFGVAERPDRLLAFAHFDSGQPFLFAVDSEGGRGTFPMVLRFPKDLKKGQVFSFELRFKSFPRPKNCYTQVMSWYLDHVYSTNPETAKAVGRKFAVIPSRPLPGGLNSWGSVSRKLPHGESVPEERVMLRQKMTMPFWISSWSVFDESYPIDDRPYFDEGQSPWTKEEVRDEIKRQMDVGLHVLMYRRNWLIWENCHDDRPPYRRWALDPEKPVEKRSIETQTLSPALQKLYGVEKIHKVMGNLNLPDFRDWYVNQVIGELGFYRPAGMWWDMGDSGQSGTIEAMRRIREEAARRHPQMRFVGNEKDFGIDGLYCDAMSIEGFEMSGKTERAFQAAKAFGRPVLNLVYTVYYQNPGFWLPPCTRAADLVTANDVRHFAMRYRLNPGTPLDETPVISARQASWRDGPKVALFKAKDLVADGEWHTATVELAGKLTGSAQATSVEVGHQDKVETKTEKAYVSAIFVELPRTALGPVRLDLDAMGFYYDKPSVDGDLVPSEQAGVNGMYYDDFSKLDNWQVPSPCITEGRYARFETTPGQTSSTWMKTDIRPLSRAYARGLGLGALPGLGPVEPDMPILQPLFDFTNDALALRPVAEPLSAFSGTKGTKVSAWVGNDRVLLAAYNEEKKPSACAITVDIPSLAKTYRFRGTARIESMLLFDADNGGRAADGFPVTRDKGRRLLIDGRLGPNELLLVRLR